MSDAVLTVEQTLKLLWELATNEGFRVRYQDKPAAALLEIGVPATVIANLSPACLVAAPLKPAAEFRKAHDQLQSARVAATTSMVIPNLRLNSPAGAPGFVTGS